MKIIKYFIIAVIFFITGFLLGQTYELENYQPTVLDKNSQDQEISQSVDLMIQFSETERLEILNIELSEEKSVLELLARVSEENNLSLETKDYGSLGVLLTSLGGKASGQDNKYWYYYVNDELIMQSADSFMLSGGETIFWQFTEETNQ